MVKKVRSKAKYHGVPGDFEGQCEASVSGGGRRCRRMQKPGSNVCESHGSRAPQVKEAARQRLAALVPKAVRVLEGIIDAKKGDKHVTTRDKLAAAKDILDRNGYKPKDEVILTAELDQTRFKDWPDEKLQQFIAMAREASTLRDATSAPVEDA